MLRVVRGCRGAAAGGGGGTRGDEGMEEWKEAVERATPCAQCLRNQRCRSDNGASFLSVTLTVCPLVASLGLTCAVRHPLITAVAPSGHALSRPSPANFCCLAVASDVVFSGRDFMPVSDVSSWSNLAENTLLAFTDFVGRGPAAVPPSGPSSLRASLVCCGSSRSGLLSGF